MSADDVVRRPGRPRAATRERVQAAAIELFLTHGYGATTMDQVAEAAGVGRTTVFRYFDSKSALVWWDFEANYVRLDEALDGTPGGGDVVDQVGAAVHAALADIGTSSTLMRRRWELIDQDPAVAAELAVLMMRWARRVADHVRAVVGPSLAVGAADAVGYAVLGATVGATRTWSEDAGERSLADVLDGVMDPLATALRAMVVGS